MNKRPMCNRRGLTLIELLLVLALLAIIGSMVTPLFGNSFAKVTLRRAGDEVLAAWAKARTNAIETGETQQFRFQVETPKYRVQSQWQADIEAVGQRSEQNGGSTTGSSGPPRTGTTAGGATNEGAGEDDPADDDSEGLKEGIVFLAGRAVDEALPASSTQATSTEAKQARQLNAGQQQWSEPILFFPDGTASTAVVTLKNSLDQYLQVTLRGLTGVGRASDVLSQSEWQDVEK